MACFQNFFFSKISDFFFPEIFQFFFSKMFFSIFFFTFSPNGSSSKSNLMRLQNFEFFFLRSPKFGQKTRLDRFN